MNHGFIDGNKRVAFASTILFLEANGISHTEEEWIEFIYSNLEGGTLRKSILQEWLSKHSQPAPV